MSENAILNAAREEFSPAATPHAAPAPGASIESLPGFEAAVAKAVAAQLAHLLPPAAQEAIPAVGDAGFAEKLAMAIAQLTDQGTERKRVPPEVIQKWTSERARMEALILEAREEGIKPSYRLVNQVVLNHRLIQPFRRDDNTKKSVPQVVLWDGIPNEYMFPLCDTAKAIFEAFCGSIGSVVDGPMKAQRPLWMTHNGLVVQGDGPASSGKISDGESAVREFAEKHGIAAAVNPNAEYVNILGSIADPARQNSAGHKNSAALAVL